MGKHIWILLTITLLLSSCINSQRYPIMATAIPNNANLPLKTTELVSSPTVNIRTPMPNLVEIVLSGGYFSIADVNGIILSDAFYQPGTIFLPPGEYRWWANIPIPTPPPGCFVTLEYYGYQKEGSFLASRDRITIQVKLGSVIAFCTPTPLGE
jgi:hypothetical protein